jgi:salicylate hydroxylase
MDLKNLNIAIIGAGYAGAAAAKALSIRGATVNVYEQATQIREVGAGIGLRPSSLDQFRRWGILDAIEKVTSPSESFEILTATGHPIAKETWPETDAYGITTRFVHRGDFIDTLIGVLPAGMVHTGHKLETIVDHGDRATVTFENGATVTTDLVIGADGIRSQVRRRLFSDQPPIFAGEHAYRAVIGAAATHGLPSGGNLRMYLGHGTKVYFLPLLHRGQVSFDVTALNPDSTPNPHATKEDLLRTVEGFDERIIATTRDLDMITVNVRAVYDIDPVDTWHTDSVALIGDAAHAMCHHQGQGANSAILDAGAIAESLAAADSVAEALEQYQGNRKPITDELQRLSRQGWSEEEVDSVFPGQRPGEIASTTRV